MNATHDAFRAAVLAALGRAPDQIEPGAFMRFSTNGKPGDKSGWCKLFADGRGGVFGCYRQGINEQWHPHERQRLTPAERAEWARQVAKAAQERERHQRQQWAENAHRNARRWAQCRPLVPGDPATLYLRQRLHAAPWPLPACLRFHPGLSYWHDGAELGTFPALVAAITSPAGELLALHRTYLTRDGSKADVPTVKKLTGAAGPLAGGCIRLAAPAGEVIGIAEGIETALSASLASGLPVCAAYSAGNLAAWQWPREVRTLAIFGDADQAGREAAERLRQRACAAALRVNVLTPTTEGADWCDVWANRAAVEIRAELGRVDLANQGGGAA
ncbi:MAG: hypothetical protein RLY71_1986 [Pseudomonadota bacterium]|jgi:phage/plasmid primase-like uncharacterized protein